MWLIFWVEVCAFPYLSCISNKDRSVRVQISQLQLQVGYRTLHSHLALGFSFKKLNLGGAVVPHFKHFSQQVLVPLKI